MKLLEIFGSTIISNVISLVIGTVTGKPSDDSLDKFLKILSTDFKATVEDIVKTAFTEHEMGQIKAAMSAAATAFRTYCLSGFSDMHNLDFANDQTAIASGILKVVIGKLTARDLRELGSISDPAEKGRATLRYIEQLKSCIYLLQVVAATDLLILQKREKIYPGLIEEKKERIQEYKVLAEALKGKCGSAQSLRTWLFTECKGIYVTCTVYLDGNVKHQGTDFAAQDSFLHYNVYKGDTYYDDKKISAFASKFQDPVRKVRDMLYREIETEFALRINTAIAAWNELSDLPAEARAGAGDRARNSTVFTSTKSDSTKTFSFW